MKTSLFKILGKKLVVISVALAVLSTIAGIFLDPKGFVVNILAGVVGVFIGFLVGISILDKRLEAQREEQCAKVRHLTYMSISNHLYDIAQEAGIHSGVQFPPDINLPASGSGRDYANPAVAKAMLGLCDKMESLPGAKSADNTLSDMAVEFYNDVQWDLSEISNVLLPRVVQSTTEQEVINSLIEFDRARLSLRNAVVVHKRIVIGGIFPDMINLIKQAQVLYSTLVNAA